ncbi:salicylate synthase [Rhizobium paknamense]|uniref:Salicylate synthase n=1 Tax=Rhizobium paknamense TaxID=1206817 RepID=A0ABU0IHN1_9HYPH|nr:salicylate synthase [Rhizobium paknamense]MDQ0457771.1 salicylate synthase [Rhizobium paknamense]
MSAVAVHAGHERGEVSVFDHVVKACALADVVEAQAGEQPYILYEKAGTFFFGAGSVAELVLNRNGFHLKTPAGSVSEPLGPQPLVQLNALVKHLLGEAPDCSRLFGWAAFEFSYLLQGLPLPSHDEPLLYLSAPRHEARIGPEGVELQLDDAALSDVWEEALRQARPGTQNRRVPVDERQDETGFELRAAEAIRAIDGKKLSKVILSRHVPVSEEIDLVRSYECLRINNTPARSFLLNLGGIAAAGVSPQAVVEVSSSGAIRTQPLAGTCARTGEPEEDRRRREDMMADPKEIYEHALSVKLAQDEIESVSAPGTVFVENFMQIVARGSVQHMASGVRGQMAEERSCWDAFASVFPAVTSSGIPKREACAVIASKEATPRGLYSGAVIMLERSGELDAALVLRSVYQKNGQTWLRAGAGLILQSTPERELEETCEKLRSVSRFLVPRAGKTA